MSDFKPPVVIAAHGIRTRTAQDFSCHSQSREDVSEMQAGEPIGAGAQVIVLPLA